MPGLRRERLETFTRWVAGNVTGDEKGQASIFLDRLFQAFGQPGCMDVGGTPEYRIRKSKEDGGGTAFADYVWKPVVLIEMKKRGVDLARHYRQAFDYWTRLVPGRPRYVVLCNFDEFWVYDFETQMDTPVDRLRVEELPDRHGPLAFLFPTPEKPVFGNDHEEVTRGAADRLATCFNKLVTRGVERPLAQRFILQSLVALFSEDIGLLEPYTFTRLLDECDEPRKSYDLLGQLFVEMNTPGVTAGGRYKGVDYFNGGLFREPASVELYEDELNQLRAAAKSDWSKVRPEIFGTLFEHSVDSAERRAYGQHFTTPVDIMKIVGPTIVEPWREVIDSAKSVKRLLELRKRLTEFHVLDPACGSGNFLYIAYREMKRLEQAIFERIDEISAGRSETQKLIGFVTANQFYGIDINPLGIELAKVTMMIARKLAIDELKMDERALPLDNLDRNFLADDALIESDPAGLDGDRGNWRTPVLTAEGMPTRVKWPRADVIVGNPPFNGAKKLKPDLGPNYVNAIRAAYDEIPGMADYCVFWFRKAHDHLPNCTADDPVAGRAGLVGTQNIRNNKSREGGLDYIVSSGTIVDAVDNQPWSGEANVHVSIANWIKHPPIDENLTEREQATIRKQLLIPEEKKLWFKVEPEPGKKKIEKARNGPAHKEYELTYRERRAINSALSDSATVSTAQKLVCNTNPQVSFQGVVPGYEGFAVDDDDVSQVLSQCARCNEVIKPWMIGRDILTGDGTPTRNILDFGDRDMQSAQSYSAAFAILRERVLPSVNASALRASGNMKSAREEHLTRWWQFWNVRSEMRSALKSIHRYIACSRVTKRPIFAIASVDIVPDGALQIWALEDDYSFGIIQSDAHWQWFYANCSNLKSDFRYTRRSVWDTFPWPQAPSDEQVQRVAQAAVAVRRVRTEALETTEGGLRGLYRLLELPGKHPLKAAHARLNEAVRDAYGFNDDTSLLHQLLELNCAVALRERRGDNVTAPGIPAFVTDRASLVTDDCIAAGLLHQCQPTSDPP